MGKRRMQVIALLGIFCLAALPLRSDDKKDDVDEIGNRKVAHKSIISEEKEIAIGKQYSVEIERSAKMLTDPVINEYVNRVAQNVARNSDLKIPLTVKVIDDPSINAFALPGGFLYVNTGLLQAADEEDQVAGVMAHEIAHVAARHWASQMTKMTFAQFAMLPLIFVPMSYPVYMGVMEAYMQGVPLAFLKFNRGAEAEADYLGIQYMYKAGYDPNSYVAFFGKVMDEERRMPGSMPQVFMDHPPTGDRIIKSEEEIKQILPKKEQYLVSTSEFDDVKARLQQVISNRKKLKPGDNGGPTLRKRQPSDQTTTAPTQTAGQSSGSSGGDEQPPVLKRRDSDSSSGSTSTSGSTPNSNPSSTPSASPSSTPNSSPASTPNSSPGSTPSSSPSSTPGPNSSN
jgi:beta-barrel assembly-enhancing protease